MNGMAQRAASATEMPSAHALAGPPIDRDHLARMTLGDIALEREVLELFDRQAMMLTARLRDAEAFAVAALAHTLKGSARGIGAWRVAQAAELLEIAGDGAPDRQAAVGKLSAAVDEARALNADMLRTH
jgi:HPt (histidine-containing phosphotransfer) domain-containing protein